MSKAALTLIATAVAGITVLVVIAAPFVAQAIHSLQTMGGVFGH